MSCLGSGELGKLFGTPDRWDVVFIVDGCYSTRNVAAGSVFAPEGTASSVKIETVVREVVGVLGEVG